MATAAASRRKSGNGGASGSANGVGGGNGTSNGLSLAAVGPSTNGAGRARMDANLRMSSNKVPQANDLQTSTAAATAETASGAGAGAGAGTGTGAGTHHVRNKSSDRLHRIGAGSSSTNLTQSKRCKSYSQIMSVTAEQQNGSGSSSSNNNNNSNNARKNSKLRRGKSDGQGSRTISGGSESNKKSSEAIADDDDDDGWTSADQTSTDSVQAKNGKETTGSDGESDEEDGMLTFGGGVGRTSKGKQSDEQNAKDADMSDKTPVVKPVALPVEKSEHPTEAVMPVRQMSEETLAVEEPSERSQTPEHVDRHLVEASRLPRQRSTASVRTLTSPVSQANATSSPSLRTSPIRSKRTSFLPRDASFHAAPPMLSTEHAVVGGGGAGSSGESARRSGLNRSSDVATFETSALVDNSSSERNRITTAGGRSVDSTPHYRFSSIGESSSSPSAGSAVRGRKSSISSTQSRSSVINLPGVTPSLGRVSHDSVNAEPTVAQTSRAIEAMQRASIVDGNGGAAPSSSYSSFTLPARERNRSTQSITGSSEAARLAGKLRMSRDPTGADDTSYNGSTTSSASRMLANSGTKYFMSIKSDGPIAKALARYNKPTVSVFVKRQDDFKTVEKAVEPGSLFDENFARASLATSHHHHDEGDADEDGRVTTHSQGKKQSIGTGTASSGNERNKYVRYVMDFGLSGPAVERTPTTQALLATCLDNDEFEATWAPALAQAAGLGAARSETPNAEQQNQYHLHQHQIGTTTSAVPYDLAMAAADRSVQGNSVNSAELHTTAAAIAAAAGGEGVYLNAPNATPLHFLHGLTNTNDSPFPLDESDMPPSSGGAAAAAAAAALGQQQNHDHRALNAAAAAAAAGQQAGGEYVDAKNLRAVALTWAALNTTKNHIVTRRYVDPMRESVERVMLAAGLASQHQHRQTNDVVNGGAGSSGTAKQAWSDYQTNGIRASHKRPATPGGGGGGQHAAAASTAHTFPLQQQQGPHSSSSSSTLYLAHSGAGADSSASGTMTPGGTLRWPWRSLFPDQPS